MVQRRTPRGRRWPTLAVLATVVGVLAAPGCTTTDRAGRVDAGSPTTTSQPAKVSDWVHEDPDEARTKAIGRLPDVCDLIPDARLGELLGGEPTGSASSSDDGKSCLWRPREAGQDPSVDGADALLVLQLRYPPVGQSIDEFWAEAEQASTGSAQVDGCDDAFWVDGLLNARKDDYVLAGTAALTNPSPAARATSEALLTEICTRL